MKTRSLILRSIAHYWRTHIGVILGSALAALVLTGALMVGDSVKATLRAQAEARVGRVTEALICGERFVRWANDPVARNSTVAKNAVEQGSAGVLLLQATAERSDGSARANRVQVLGVDEAFWKLSPSGQPVSLGGSANEIDAAFNGRLAAQLGVQLGDVVILRMEKPSAFSKDAPLSGEEENAQAMRLRVARIVGDADFGRFALVSGQVPPASVFVPVAALQQKLGLGEKVNVVLSRAQTPRDELEALKTASSSSIGESRYFEGQRQFLEEADLRVVPIPGGGFELRTPRVFLDDAIVQAARANEQDKAEADSGPPIHGIDALTYFVTELRAGNEANAKSTPYSMVTAVDAPASGFLQAELAEDEIQITRWLADDLGVGPGDKITVKYFVMGDKRELVNKERTFTVLAPILEMNEPQLNTSWLPDFPNVPEKGGLKRWKLGSWFEQEKIRTKDEEYWDQYRGTPKAFVSLRAGKQMWGNGSVEMASRSDLTEEQKKWVNPHGNRWGELTSIRYRAGTTREQVERIAHFIDPAALGFRVLPLRDQAFAATNAPVDFGQLFGGFSFFLIAAAAVLTGLLFTFSIEQRATEAGLLLAVGWPVKSVRRLFLREGFLLALIGSILGVACAILYTKIVLHALASVWSGATGGTAFVFALSPITLGIGVASGVLVALFAMWLASRRLFQREAARLLAGEGAFDAAPATAPKENKTGKKRPSRGISRMLLGAFILVLLTSPVWLPMLKLISPMIFFALGFLLLVAGILFCRDVLIQLARGTGVRNLTQLGTRNTSRRRGRSLATIAVLASGVFMVVAVDSFRKGPLDDPSDRSSGTGGFALVGESSSPIYEDLNTEKGQEQYSLDSELLKDVHIVQLRVREGDDASCLNLNRAVQPRLLGISAREVERLDSANAFSFPRGQSRAWMRLSLKERRNKADPLPAFVDGNTLQWAMQKKVGDTFDYTDERGQSFQVMFSATMLGSMLQGLVIISEEAFVEKFPNSAGYRFFLVDGPPAKMQQVREHLSKQLGDRGLELVPAAQRLAEFNAVENTYLSIFQVLGGLGMLLGSAGLGIVVARNVLERRREFGLLEAVGFTPRQLRRLVFAEHRWLIVGALLIGAASAMVAVWPQLSQKAGEIPWSQLGILFGGMAVVGIACAWLATRLALRGSQLEGLRSE